MAVFGREGSQPNDSDGLMNDQVMPTADGQMASNTTEEVVPPKSDRSAEEDREKNSEVDAQEGTREEAAGAPDVSVPSGGDSPVGDEPT